MLEGKRSKYARAEGGGGRRYEDGGYGDLEGVREHLHIKVGEHEHNIYSTSTNESQGRME